MRKQPSTHFVFAHGRYNAGQLDPSNLTLSPGTTFTWVSDGAALGQGFAICANTANTCDQATNLAFLTSPFSGSATFLSDDFQLSCGGSGGEKIFYKDLGPNQSISISQTSSTFVSRVQLAFGGACPGTSLVQCVNISNTATLSWINSRSSTTRVYVVIEAVGSPSTGSFVLAWSISENATSPTTAPTTTPPTLLPTTVPPSLNPTTTAPTALTSAPTFRPTMAPSASSCSQAVSLANRTAPYIGSTVVAPHNVLVSCGGHPAGRERIFYLDAPNSAQISIELTYSSFDALVQLASGGSCPGQTVIACSGTPDGQVIRWTNTAGGTVRVYFVIDAVSTDAGNFSLTWSLQMPTLFPTSAPPTAAPTPSGAFQVTSGGCSVTQNGTCVSSGLNLGGDAAACTIRVLQRSVLYTRNTFVAAPCCERLVVDGHDYTGTTGPQGDAISPDDIISWIGGSGGNFLVCTTPSPTTTAPTSLSPTSPAPSVAPTFMPTVSGPFMVLSGGSTCQVSGNLSCIGSVPNALGNCSILVLQEVTLYVRYFSLGSVIDRLIVNDISFASGSGGPNGVQVRHLALSHVCHTL